MHFLVSCCGGGTGTGVVGISSCRLVSNGAGTPVSISASKFHFVPRPSIVSRRLHCFPAGLLRTDLQTKLPTHQVFIRRMLPHCLSFHLRGPHIAVLSPMPLMVSDLHLATRLDSQLILLPSVSTDLLSRDMLLIVTAFSSTSSSNHSSHGVTSMGTSSSRHSRSLDTSHWEDVLGTCWSYTPHF